MKKLSNITLKEFRAVLTALGLHKMRTKGGHEPGPPPIVSENKFC